MNFLSTDAAPLAFRFPLDGRWWIGAGATPHNHRLRAGARLGKLGSSGNSTEPHLHFHVCDAPHPLNCAGVPVRFDNIEIPWAERARQLQSGDMVRTR